MPFNGWTRKLIWLPLCLFLIGWVTSMAGLRWMMESGRSTLHNESLNSITDATLHVFYLTAVWEPFVCMFGALHVALPYQPSSVFSAVIAFVSILCYVFSGDIAIKIARDIFPIVHLPVASYVPRAPTHLDVTFLLIGTLIKGLSWLLFVVLTIFLTYTYKSKEARNHSTSTTTNTHQVARVLIVPLIYISVIGWTVFTSAHVVSDFGFPDSVLYPYLAALMLAGFLGDDTMIVGVLVSIFYMYVAFMAVDLYEIVYRCSTYWPQLLCTQLNPLHFNTTISGGIVSIFLCICIHDLWPFSHKQSSGEKHCPAAAEETHITGEQPLAYNTPPVQEQQQCRETKPSIENTVYIA